MPVISCDDVKCGVCGNMKGYRRWDAMNHRWLCYHCMDAIYGR